MRNRVKSIKRYGPGSGKYVWRGQIYHYPQASYHGPSSGSMRSPVVRLVALFTVLAFAGLALILSLPGLRFPALDFIVESGRLGQDPALRQLQTAVVQIKVIARQDSAFGFLSASQRSGTGFNIHPGGAIVTNHHVISEAVKITATFSGGETYNAQSWVSWPELDLAMVYLDAPDLPRVYPSLTGRVRTGEVLTIIGHPLGLDAIITRGTAGSYFFVSGIPTPVFDINAAIHRGNSGSPVFNAGGEVVGVVFGTIRRQEQGEPVTRGVAVPIANLVQMLETRDRTLDH
jgi:S1-C subfamily serine protease